VLGGPKAELDFQVETSNSVRAVIRIEGGYVRGKDEQVARAVLRYHIHWGQPWMRVEHHFIVTRDNDDVSYREVGVRMPLKPAKTARASFGVKDARSAAVTFDGHTREGFVFQSRYPVYYKTESECVAGSDGKSSPVGQEAEGWCDLGNGEAGLVLAVKDFAPQFPAELSADSGGVTAKLWSGRDGKVLDYRPATLAKDWWGDWVNRVDKIAPTSVDRVYTPEQVRDRNPSAVGVARTHELFVGYYAGAQNETRARQWNAKFQSPPVVYPDPRWTCHVDARAFWPMAAAGEGGKEFDDVEKFISAYFDEFMTPLSVFPYTGWYDWGKHPELRYVKEPKEDGRIYSQWWRLAYNNQYQTTKHFMLGWARSGDRRLLDAARRFNRFQLDYKILHAAGGKEKKRLGYFVWASPHQLPFWFSGSGVLGMTGDTEFVTGPALEYLFLDNRWAKDSLALVKKAVLADFQPTPKFTIQAPDMVLSYLTGLYRVLPDDTLKTTAQTLFDTITDVNAPVGMKESFFNEIGGHYKADYKINRKAMALVEYCDVFGADAKAQQIVAKAAKAAFEKSAGNVCNYCEFHGASNSRVWQWTRDKDRLDIARQQIAGVNEFFTHYTKLPASDRLVERMRKFTTTNALAQASPHNSFSFPGFSIKDKDGHPLPMVIASCSTGVPYLSLPTAIWALKQNETK
jgi:hypothetical protein